MLEKREQLYYLFVKIMKQDVGEKGTTILSFSLFDWHILYILFVKKQLEEKGENEHWYLHWYFRCSAGIFFIFFSLFIAILSFRQNNEARCWRKRFLYILFVKKQLEEKGENEEAIGIYILFVKKQREQL